MEKASSIKRKHTHVSPSLLIMTMSAEKGFAYTGDGDSEGYTNKEGEW